MLKEEPLASQSRLAGPFQLAFGVSAMRNKRFFVLCTTMALDAAVWGCGEGPVPAEKKVAGSKTGSGTSTPAEDKGTEARSGKTSALSRRSMSILNLKQIGFAAAMYASTYNNAFPPAAILNDGKPFVSWRVLLLPFIEEADLYKKYRMDEPWDSVNNLEVAKKMPKVYKTPSRPDDSKTCYMMFTGDGAPLNARNIGSNVPMAVFTNGARNTILVAEVGPEKAVPWTKPEDLPFDPASPLTALGQIPEEGFLAAMADGSVHRFQVDNATLKSLIQPNRGKEINIDTLPGVH
jgi:hypothetical protein